MDLVQKSLAGQNVTIGPPMYKCIEWILTGNAKAELLQQTNLVETCTVVNFTTEMNTMTAHILPTYTNCDQNQYIQNLKRRTRQELQFKFKT